MQYNIKCMKIIWEVQLYLYFFCTVVGERKKSEKVKTVKPDPIKGRGLDWMDSP